MELDDSREPLMFQEIFSRIHHRFDHLAKMHCAAPSHPACSSLHSFYGGLFRCHSDTCTHYYNGFDTESAREKHILKHERPFKCRYDTCDFYALGFETEIERKEHYSEVHPKIPIPESFEFSLETLDQSRCRNMLMSAIESGDLDLVINIVALCHRKKVSIHSDGYTIYKVAGKSGSQEVFLHLLHQFPSTQSGICAWFHAVKNGFDDVLDFLIESRIPYPKAQQTGISVIHAAVMAGSERNLLLLIDYGASVNEMSHLKGMKTSGTALHQAVVCENLPSVKILLSYGADLLTRATNKATALHLAAQIGSQRMAQCLIDNGASITAHGYSGETPLETAAKEGSESVVRLLLKHLNGTVPKSIQKSILHLVVGRIGASEAVVQLLIDSGMTLDVESNAGFTPLHIAAETGSEKIVEFLLSRGANPTASGKNGWTPFNAVLERTARPHQTRVSRIISLLCGGNSTMKTWVLQELMKGDRYFASNTLRKRQISTENRLRLASTLVSGGADINARDITGKSVLFIGLCIINKGLVKYLLDLGADPTVLDHKGDSIFHHFAYERKNWSDIYIESSCNWESGWMLPYMEECLEIFAQAILKSNKKESFDFASAIEALKGANLPIPKSFKNLGISEGKNKSHSSSLLLPFFFPANISKGSNFRQPRTALCPCQTTAHHELR